MTEKQQNRVRIDKWLWAARFYRTRAIAKQAIDGGKVHCNGSRTKPSKEIEIGCFVKEIGSNHIAGSVSLTHVA